MLFHNVPCFLVASRLLCLVALVIRSVGEQFVTGQLGATIVVCIGLVLTIKTGANDASSCYLSTH